MRATRRNTGCPARRPSRRAPGRPACRRREAPRESSRVRPLEGSCVAAPVIALGRRSARDLERPVSVQARICRVPSAAAALADDRRRPAHVAASVLAWEGGRNADPKLGHSQMLRNRENRNTCEFRNRSTGGHHVATTTNRGTSPACPSLPRYGRPAGEGSLATVPSARNHEAHNTRDCRKEAPHSTLRVPRMYKGPARRGQGRSQGRDRAGSGSSHSGGEADRRGHPNQSDPVDLRPSARRLEDRSRWDIAVCLWSSRPTSHRLRSRRSRRLRRP
jgi:hypothetical protein